MLIAIALPNKEYYKKMDQGHYTCLYNLWAIMHAERWISTLFLFIDIINIIQVSQILI